MADEMGKKPRISVHEPCGKQTPQKEQEAPTKSDPLRKHKSGLPRPRKAAHSSNNAALQLRLKESSQEVATTLIPICSSTSVAKKPRVTHSAGVRLPDSRIPSPICRLPNHARSSGCHIKLKGGQGEKSEKAQKCQYPFLEPPVLPVKQATTLIKHGNSGLPPSVLGKESLTSINLPLKTEKISSTTTQSSLKTFNNSPDLLPIYQVLKKQHGGEIPSLGPLSPSSDMKAVLPPDEFDLSTPEFISDKVFTPEIPHCKKHISSLGLKFPESNVQMELLPSNLSKNIIIPVEYPCSKQPIPSFPTILDFSSGVGQKKSSFKKDLEMFGSTSSTFSNKEFPESITGSSTSQDFFSLNCDDIPDTKKLSPSYPLPSSSGEMFSASDDVSQEKELLRSSRTQICTSIGSSNTSALSSEEKMVGRMEEEFDSGNWCDEDKPKYNSCIIL